MARRHEQNRVGRPCHQGIRPLLMAALLACMYGTRPVHGQLDPQEDAGALPMAFEAVDRRFKHAPKDVLAIAATVLEGTELMGSMLDDFKMSLDAYAALTALPHAPDSVQCLWHEAGDSGACKLNPTFVTGKNFPTAVLPIELMFQHVAKENLRCRQRSKSLEACNVDTLCQYHGPGEGCVYGRDLHDKIASTLHHCMDSLYQKHLRPCFNTDAPTAATCKIYPGCKLFTKSKDGVPRDACMPAFIKDAPHAYEILQSRKKSKQFSRHGFGTCHAAALQHAAHAMCKHSGETACSQDKQCTMLRGTLSGDYCIVSKPVLRQLYFNGSSFMGTYEKSKLRCDGAMTKDACDALNTATRPRSKVPEPTERAVNIVHEEGLSAAARAADDGDDGK